MKKIFITFLFAVLTLCSYSQLQKGFYACDYVTIHEYNTSSRDFNEKYSGWDTYKFEITDDWFKCKFPDNEEYIWYRWEYIEKGENGGIYSLKDKNTGKEGMKIITNYDKDEIWWYSQWNDFHNTYTIIFTFKNVNKLN